MKAFSRFRSWILGPKSDFFLFLAVLVLANLVGANAFFRVDLTARRSYTLSEASRRAVKTIEEPLSVKVFFSANLPAPYNSVERYLEDLLIEYRGAGNKRFSYQFFDMERPENKDTAESYGIYPAQIQEVKNDEVGIKNAYMGLAIAYSDAIETMNDITSADGLEYRLTTTIGRIVSRSNALAGLSGSVKVTVYASSSLAAFRIQGYDKLDALAREAFARVNARNRGRLEYAFVPAADQAEIARISARYGVQKINWEAQAGIPAGAGLLGVVVEHGDRFRSLPLSLSRGLFGGYALAGLETLEERLAESLEGLTSSSPAIGYIVGHGERDLQDDRQGAAALGALVADSYEFKQIDLSRDDIPAGIGALVVNGPKTTFMEEELYKIDQFLMRGGSLFALLDPFEEIAPQGGGFYGAQPSYIPIRTGLEEKLEKYGVKLSRNYVLDAASYVARQPGAPDQPLYFAPMVGKKSLDQTHPVSRNLANVIFLKAGEVAPAVGSEAAGRRTAALASSSQEAWTIADRINLMPYALSKPAKDKLAPRGLMLLVEGRLESAFGSAPAAVAESGSGGLAASAHLSRAVQDARIIVAGTSEIAGPALIDESGRQPVAILVRNAIDYLAGNGELADMRTKGLGAAGLNKTTPTLRTAAKAFNQYGLPLLVALAGLFAWRRRVRRRAAIQAAYAEKDARTEASE